MINPIEWFKGKEIQFDDERISIRDVIELQLDAKESGIELATDLYESACCLMRHQQDKSCWHNLQNAAARWNAARQAVRNDAIINSEFVQDLGAGTDQGHPTREGDSAGLAPLKPSCSGSETFPEIMGRQITRTEIMEGLWIMYGEMVKLEKLSCPDFKRFPDTETILHFIEEKGLPPKNL